MFWKFEPYLYEHFISYCATPQYGGIIPYMNSNWRRKNSGLPRGRGGRGVWGEFRRARAFRRSEAEAVSSVQKMFEQSCIIPPWRRNCASRTEQLMGVQSRAKREIEKLLGQGPQVASIFPPRALLCLTIAVVLRYRHGNTIK